MHHDRYQFTMSVIADAGERLLSLRDRGFTVAAKGADPRDLVTDVDHAVGAFIEEKIRGAYPGETILSEEHEFAEETHDTYWSIDPIDGTSNFARHIPHYAVVVSFMEQGTVRAGAVYNPATNELFSYDGTRAYLNGEPLRAVSGCRLEDAYVLLHIGRAEAVRDWGLSLQRTLLAKAKKNINLGSSSLDLCFLAAGRVDAVVYGTLTARDVACALGIVRATGAEVYEKSGMPARISREPQLLIGAVSRTLFDEIRSVA